MAIVAVCRLVILKRMPVTPLTLLVAHRVREEVKVQLQRSERWRPGGGSRTQRANKGRKREQVERDNCVSWDKIVF